MHLVFHGGKCCGIKTIYGFERDPEDELDALPAIPKNSADIMYHTVGSNIRFFHLAAPEESRLKRLDRYLDFVKKHRPSHIIEVTLAESDDRYLNQTIWFPLLEERGFIRVNKAKNSNSGNIVHVFHLNIEQGCVCKKEDK